MGERRDEIGVGEADYAAFERTLHEVADAYGRQDVATLWTLATPEMAGYLQEELNEDAQNGIRRKGTGVRLLQGDLAEAWREGDTDYATVAMRFTIAEVTVDKASGRIVSGDANTPIEATEVWTFRRDRGGPWKLSAIQQAA
jgi:predicted lipid-binding transport protein (Tim44 family)